MTVTKYLDNVLKQRFISWEVYSPWWFGQVDLGTVAHDAAYCLFYGQTWKERNNQGLGSSITSVKCPRCPEVSIVTIRHYLQSVPPHLNGITVYRQPY